jgi:hypothetical protein
MVFKHRDILPSVGRFVVSPTARVGARRRRARRDGKRGPGMERLSPHGSHLACLCAGGSGNPNSMVRSSLTHQILGLRSQPRLNGRTSPAGPSTTPHQVVSPPQPRCRSI